MAFSVKRIQEKIAEIKSAINQNVTNLQKLIADQKKIEDAILEEQGMLASCNYWLGDLQKEEAQRITPEELESALVAGGNSPGESKKIVECLTGKGESK